MWVKKISNLTFGGGYSWQMAHYSDQTLMLEPAPDEVTGCTRAMS